MEKKELQNKMNRMMAKASLIRQQMYDAIVEVVKANNGFIITDHNARKDKDSLFAINYDDEQGTYTSDYILAIMVEDDKLFVFLSCDEGEYIDDIEEAKEDDRWYSFESGYLNPSTLENICEVICQYV